MEKRYIWKVDTYRKKTYINKKLFKNIYIYIEKENMNNA